MEGSLTIDLFGPMRVLVDGEPMPRVRSRKALWLLALLALRNGRPAAREWVADALWPDAEGGQGLANLRPLLSELRSALGSQGGRLQATDRTVALNIEGAMVDALEFDEAIRRGDLAHAVELYRGELLEGCAEEWVVQEQRVRETSCLMALQGLGDAALAEGNPQTAADLFMRAIGLDPLRDAPRRGLMAALAATGDVNAALQSYREFARLLSAEVSTSPDKETTRLYDQLRADLRRPAKQDSKPTPNNLVQPLTALVGREDEAEDVENLLRRSRLVTLTGVGGIGKTRLAASVATAALSEYPGGVWFIALDALADGRTVVGAVATEVGLRDGPERPLVMAITERLKDGRYLLVLDNCEHLLEASADLVVRLLRECPDLRILATSREALGIPGETVWPVPPLAFPSDASLPEGRATRRRVAEGYESVRLFVERAKAARPAFELDDTNLDSVIEVCAQVDGLPLGIELAAARVRSMSMDTLRERLKEHHLEMLQGHGRGQNPRQSALRATLDWSYALLEDEDRRLMARLAVFAGGWTLEAAERVCGATDTAEQLRSLVEKSIVVFDDHAERYRFLETVRQYAHEKLEESGEAERALADHRTWCMDFANRAKPNFRGPGLAEWLGLTALEWPNLRKALDQGDREPTFALRLAAALWYYLYIRSAREDYRYLEETLGREGADDPGARAEVLLGLGCITFSERSYDASQTALRESLTIFQSIGDKGGAGRTLGILGNVAAIVEGYEQATGYYEKSLAMLREVDDRAPMALTLNNLATLAADQNDFPRARACYEEGLELAREQGSGRLVAWMLVGLASLMQRQGLGQAVAYEQEALELFQELGEKRGVAVLVRHQGLGHLRQGAAASAILKLEESIRLFREIGDAGDGAHTEIVLAFALMNTGDLATAEGLAQQALETMREIGEASRIADCLYVVARIMREKGDARQAWDCLLEGLNLLVEIGARSNVADFLDLIAERAATLCVDDHAAYIFGASEALREALGTPRFEIDELTYHRRRDQARTRLGAALFDEFVEAGRTAPWREAAARATEPLI